MTPDKPEPMEIVNITDRPKWWQLKWTFQEVDFHWWFGLGFATDIGSGWSYDSLGIHVGFWTFMFMSDDQMSDVDPYYEH